MPKVFSHYSDPSQFWKEVWQDHDIPFHKTEPNPVLLKWKDWWTLQPQDQIFVPLCGKSQDLIFLRNQDFRVFGVELIQDAVEEFFEENRLPFQRESEGEFFRYRAENIEILQGDFFKLEAHHLREVKAVYDRASLIALPAPLRASYYEVFKSALPSKTQILLATIEYEQTGIEGPPFSVSDSEIHSFFQSPWTIELLEAHQEGLGDIRGQAVTSLLRRVYGLSRT